MLKRLRDASDERNKHLMESINKKLTKMENIVKNVFFFFSIHYFTSILKNLQ